MKKQKLTTYKSNQDKLVQQKKKEEKPLIISNNESDRHQEYDGKWQAFSKVYRTQNPFCKECLKEGILNDEHIQVDHIIPLVKRPDLKYEATNLQSLCRSCHGKKTYKETLALQSLNKLNRNNNNSKNGETNDKDTY